MKLSNQMCCAIFNIHEIDMIFMADVKKKYGVMIPISYVGPTEADFTGMQSWKKPKGKTLKTWAKLTGIARETKEFYGEIGMMENKSGEVVVTISGEEKLLKYATPGTLRDAKPRGVPESPKMIIKTEMDAYFKK
ncbi:hypothetical protein L2E82_24520 [Cichorium intybus]|uniref:Uncharacterized protein n=1 Tax=Cichorium intybus TaxID=13427 RepID=A0ACB9E206_CICIN|nr:hypothetical protein L2E82_24520 [Cichorium intybus]